VGDETAASENGWNRKTKWFLSEAVVRMIGGVGLLGKCTISFLIPQKTTRGQQ
jgi:hypothetical protein